jgi:hypothetical protein
MCCSGRLESKEAPVHSTATLKMPHELGHRMAVDGEVLPEHSLESDDATSSKAENAKGNDRAMQVRHCAWSGILDHEN